MKKAKRRYVIYVLSEDADDLRVRKVYEVLEDRSAEAHGHLRVVDESGEDYLYPQEWFVPVELRERDQRALSAISPVLTRTP
jgi:hypothetical protein